MKYLAHISDDFMHEQTLKEHLEGTANLAGLFAASFGFEEWGYCCGKAHDIGKYSEKFQRRIRGSGEKTDHATAGAQLFMEKKGFYSLLSYCIAGHHAGLPDTGESADAGDSRSYIGRMKKKVEDYRAYQEEIQIPELSKEMFILPQNQDPSFSVSFLIRMLFSCLVDADYLDTENFMKNGQAERKSGEPMSVLFQRLQQYISGWMKEENLNSVNGRRTEILKNCLRIGKQNKGLFRLTVPTGGGKTVASMAFALQHAKEHHLDHIIYVIPYTSIIEQNAKVFAQILGRENVLEHHCSVNYESEEELKPMQLATENWDKPVIVTTNVQFFESLFSNKSSKCRKLHNIANSIVIFDEAQMLPNDYLKPCVAAMEELVRHYESSIVLCTATQPALQNLFSIDAKFQELCPRMEEQFRFFKRTTVKNLGKIAKEDLLEKLGKEWQALCILNTKKRVQSIYKDMMEDGVYHLSTLMYPIHRKRVLEEIRIRLKMGKKCIVLATSLVEAGVDLDFQKVYRQLAGIDSIVQAAGRCNREGTRTLEESTTCVFQFEEPEKVPGQEQQIDTAKQVIRSHEDIASLEAIQEYFARLYGFRGDGLDKKKIMEQFKKGRFPFARVGRSFKLIEENTRTIFIAKEEPAKEILVELRRKGATKTLLREASHYCVSVYENLFDKLNGAGMLGIISEDLKEEMFVLQNLEAYTEKTGLKADVETGCAVWL